MANDEDLDFKELLNTFRKNFKKAAVTSGQAFSSPAQASASQPETAEPTPSQPPGPEFQIEEVPYNNAVGRVAFFNVSDATKDAVRASVRAGDPTNHGEPADKNEGGCPDSSTPSKSKEDKAEPSKANQGRARLSMEDVMMLGHHMLLGMAAASDKSPEVKKSCGSDNPPNPKKPSDSSNPPPVQRGTSPPLDRAPAQKASTRGYQKPSVSPVRNENHGSPADDDQQASQHNKTENVTATTSPESSRGGERGASPLQAGPKETPASSSSANSLLEYHNFRMRSMVALTARVDEFIDKFTPKYRQPFQLFEERVVFVRFFLRHRGASAEYYATLPNQAMVKAFAFAGDGKACDLMRRFGWEIIFLKQDPLDPERATDGSAIPAFGKPVQAAKADEPSAAHLLSKPKAHKKGAILEKTAQKKFESINMSHPHAREGSYVDEDHLMPPIIYQEGRMVLCLPPSSSGPYELADSKIRVQDTGLSADEWGKVPNEFRNLDQETLVQFWNLAYNPVIRKRVLDYKRDLTLAGKADGLADWPNKLLAALVDIQEAEIQKGVEHVVVASENKTSEHELGGSATTEEIMERSGTNILAAALLEIDKSIADPSYNTTTARENFALSKGAKLNSLDIYEFFHYYQKLRTSHYSKTNTTGGDNKMTPWEKMALLELKVFDDGKDEESEPAMGEVTSSKVKGKEGDLLVEEAPATGQAKTKGKKKSGKGGKKKKSNLLMDDAAIDKGKERDMLVEGSTIEQGKGKGKERDMLMEGSTIDQGKGKGKELPLEDATAGKGKAKESNVLVKDQANGKGKGKENDLPVKDTTKGKGKEGDQSSSGGSRKLKLTLDLNTEPQLTPSSTLVDDLGESRPTFDHVADIFHSKSSATEEEDSAARMSLLCFMDDKVRLQKASSDELNGFCEMLSAQVVFDEMSLTIEELKWNRAVVEHPNNPMITELLQRTQHLRPTNGLHHPFGISFAPLLLPLWPPLPPGPSSATPVVTTPTKEQLQEQRKKPQSVMEQISERLKKPYPFIERMREQHKKVEPSKEQPQKVQPTTANPAMMDRPQKELPKKQRTGIVALPKIPIKVQLPFENPADVLALRKAVIDAKLADGAPIDAAQINADLIAIHQTELYLMKKAAMEPAGGPAGIMLAERQRQMAEAIGAPDWLLPDLPRET